MRVPPETISGSPQWHLPAAMSLLAFVVLVAGFFSGFDGRAIATQSNRITKLQVVVTKRSIEAGELISKDDLILDVRPIESLPEDVLTVPAPAIGLKAVVNIHEGTALTPQFLSVPGAETVQQDSAPQAVAEPTVHEVAPAVTKAPTVAAPETPKALPDAAVGKKLEQSGDPVKPRAKDEPAADGVKTSEVPNQPAAPVRSRKKFSSYAWVSGAGVTFGVDKSGKIQVVDPSGMSAPLDKDEEGEQ